MVSPLEYAILATRAYKRSPENTTNLPDPTWNEIIAPTNDSLTGFSYGVYTKGNETVIAFTGTNETKWVDFVWGNVPAGIGGLSPQVIQAMQIYLQVRENIGGNITFTGHSLGGGLASLMSAFFGKSAVTFDPAPFSFILNDVTLMLYRLAINAAIPEFEALIGNPVLVYSRSLLTNYYWTRGEVLEPLRYSFSVIGVPTDIFEVGDQQLGAIDLHSMSLLTAAVLSKDFRDMALTVPNSLTPFFDDSLYTYDPAISNKVNFLDKLLNAQIGSKDKNPINLLDKYADDLIKLAGNSGVSQTQYRKQLFAVAADYYYLKEPEAIDKIFTKDSGAIHFKYSDIGGGVYKSQTLLKNEIAKRLRPHEQYYSAMFASQNAWHVQEGAGAMHWSSSALNEKDLAIGGIKDDFFDAGTGDDILFGDRGRDVFIGGLGANTLIGGIDYDTYVVKSNGGFDTIVDNDGQIILDGKKLYGGFRKQGELVYWNSEKTISYKLQGGDLIISGTGGANISIKNFVNGALDIVLTDGKEPNPDPSPKPPNYWPRFSVFSIKIDPIVLDLNHNGKIDTISSKASNAYFDFNSDNIAERCGWISAEDGLLSIDTNGNDVVDGLFELFGNAQTSGFVDLKQRINSNGDNVIDSNDSKFNSLRIWKDQNGDGISQQGELFTLAQLNVTSIDLASTATHIASEDNLIAATSSFLQQGQVQLVADVELAVNFALTDSNPTRSIDVTPIFEAEIYLLPELSGYGSVKNFHQAMQDDIGLRTIVTEFVNKDVNYIFDNFKLLARRWSGLDTIHQSKNIIRQDLSIEDKAWMLESLVGLNVYKQAIENSNFNLPTPTDTDRWNEAYIDEHFNIFISRAANSFALQLATSQWLFGVVYSTEVEKLLVVDSMVAQDSLIAYFQRCSTQEEANFGVSILLALKSNGAQFENTRFNQELTSSPFSNLIDHALNFSGKNYAVIGIDHIGKFVSDTSQELFAIGSKNDDVILASAKNDFIQSNSGNDSIFGKSGEDTIFGGLGDDFIHGDQDSDTLKGESGNDVIYGGDGGDAIDGGDGDDKLYGDAGEDSIDAGNGDDWVVGGDGNDQLSGGSGLDYLYGNAGNDVINGNDGDDSLIGDVGDDSLFGGQGKDYLSGGDGKDSLEGGAGNDELYGGVGDDLVLGGDGDDYLEGGVGHDVFDGGAGNDLFKGGSGNDIFHWGRGSGADTLINNDADSERIDVIQVGFGVKPSDILVLDTEFYHSAVLKIKGTNDSLTIQDGFVSDNKSAKIDQIRFEDGTIWTIVDLIAKSNLGSDGNDVINGSDRSDFMQGNLGDDTLNGGLGNDTLDGGEGNDLLNGGLGSDTYIFGRLHGRDVIVESIPVDGFESNVVFFNSDVLPADVEFAMVEPGDTPSTLAVTIRGSTSTLIINNFFLSMPLNDGKFSQQISHFKFASGELITADEIREKLLFAQITTGDDLIHGFDGTDILSGGAGDDTIDGNRGSDIYKFGRNSGNDTFYERYADPGEYENIVLLDDDISPSDVVLKRDVESQFDLLLSISGSTNVLRLQRYLSGTYYHFGSIKFSDGTIWNEDEVARRINLGTPAVDLIVGTDFDEVFDGLGGDDQIEGGAGADTYIFDLSSGSDTILDRGDSRVANNSDQIKLGAGILPSDVKLKRASPVSPDDILLSVSGSNQILRIQAGLSQGYDGLFNYAIEKIKFSDGTSWDFDAIKLKVNQGTDGDDILNGFTTSDDTLDGLSGSDRMAGFDGSDTYSFGRNYGNDFVEDLDRAGFGDGDDIDVVKLGAGILPEDILVSKDNNESLILSIQGTADKLTINRYFEKPVWANGASPFQIEKIQFENGIVWDYNAVLAAFMRGTNGDDNIYGKETDDTINGFGGNDLVFGAGGNDRLYGGDGNDTVVGGNGDDIVDGNSGNDELRGGDGFDQFIFGRLSGNDVINDGDNQTVVQRDRIVLDSGISPFDVSLGRNVSGSNIALVLSIEGSSSTLKLDWYFYGADLNPSMRQEILFADGTIWNAEKIKELSTPVANRAPIVSEPIADQAAKQNILFNFTIPEAAFKDLDTSDVLTYSASLSNGSALPSWLKFNASTKTFSGTPTVLNTVSVKVTVKDKEGLAVSDAFDIVVGSSNQVLNGTIGADNLIGNIGNDTLTGFAGDDLLDGGAGADTLIGGLGDDVYVVDSTTDVVTENVNEGADTIKSSVTLTLAPNVENLTLTGTTAINGTGNALNNVLTGNSAINTLDGGVGADTLAGAAGNDIYTVDNINDVIVENANEGTDQVNSSVSFTLSANVEKLTLTGTASINATGNAAANTLTGNAGNNVLDGGSGNDSMVGGAGNDTYVVDSSGDIVTEAASAGTDLVQSSVSYTLGTNLENLTLTGTANINASGNTAANILFGNSGNNVLDGGTGADTMTGGAGNDIYVRDNTGDVITENASEGIDQVKSSLTYTLIANLESLLLTGTTAINGTGNALDNLLIGNSGKNILNGGAGNDILQGVAGDDTLTDTAGNNIFDGGAGIDVITAGTGNDFIVGGLGNDTITTSTGVDVVAFNRGDGMDTLVASTGKDNTLSLGKGIKYADLLFKKSGNDLILVTGTSEQVTMKDWYTNVNNRSIANLQIVIEGTTDYNAASTNKLNNKKIEQFNFDGLVTKFDQARAANPSLTSWALSSSLLEFYLNSSDTAAIGGDLAYQYAKSGNLSAFSMTPAQALLSSAQYGNSAQALQSTTSLQDASVRLM